MAVSLSATMQGRSITVTVAGLSEEHTGGRTFTWTLDDGAATSEKVYSAVSSYSHTFQNVRYAPTHTVTVQISDINDKEQYYSGSVDVADDIALWSWKKSNGEATDEQVKAAYTALTETRTSDHLKGLTTDFSRMVWNDLVDATYTALTASGLSWDRIHATYDKTKMGAEDDALTADRFNSLSWNLRYPWMEWACKPDRSGYLGRLAVASGDVVYGSYLLEIAHILNVMVDAIGDKGAGYATLMADKDYLRIATSENLRMRTPLATRCASPDDYLRMHGFAEMLAFLCRQNFVSDILPSVSGRQSMVTPWVRKSFLTDVLPSVREEPSILSVPACVRATTTDTIHATTHDDSVLLTRMSTKMLLDDYLRITSAETILMQSGRPLALTLTDQVGRVSDSLRMVVEKVKRYLEHSAVLGSYDVTMIAAASGLLSLAYHLYLDSSMVLSASPSGILLMDNHFGPVSNTALLANPAAQLLAQLHIGQRSDTRLFPRPSDLLRVALHFGPGSDSRLYPSPSSRLAAGHHLGPVPNVVIQPGKSRHLTAGHRLGPSPDVVIQPDDSDHLVAGHHLGPSPNVLIRPDKAEHLDAVHHLCPSSDVKIRSDKSDHLTAGHHSGPSPDVIIQPGKSGHLGAKHKFGPAPDVLIQPGKSGHLKAGHRLGPEPDVIIQPGKSGHLSAGHHLGPSPNVLIQPGKSGHLKADHHLGSAPDVIIRPGKSGHLVAGHRLGPTPDALIQPGKSGHLAAGHHLGPSSETELYPSPSEYLMVTLHDGPVSDSKLHPSPSKHLVATLHYGPVSDSELYPSPSEYLKAAVHTGPASVTKLFPSPSEYLKAENNGGPSSDTRLFPSPSEYLSADNHTCPASDTELYPSPSELLRANPHLGPTSDSEMHPSPSALLRAVLHFGAASNTQLTPDSATHLSHFATVLSGIGAEMATEYRPGDTVTDDLMSVANAILRWAESVHMQHTEASAGRSSGNISLFVPETLSIQDDTAVGRIVSGSILPMIAQEARKMPHEAWIQFGRQELNMRSPASAKCRYVGRHRFIRQELPGKSPGAAKGRHSAMLHITVGSDPVLSTPSSSLTVSAGITDNLRDSTGTARISPTPSVYTSCADEVAPGLAQTCTMATIPPTAQIAFNRSMSSMSAGLHTTEASKCGVTGSVATRSSAALETELVGTEWVYPVDRGTDLLIQQAKVITDRGTDLLIQ